MKKSKGKLTPKETATAKKMVDQMGMGMNSMPPKGKAKKGKKSC